jgi:hypothetical protein
VSTRRSPDALVPGRVTVVVDEPALCTKVGAPVDGGVVTLTGKLAADALPEASRATTAYW